MKNKTTPEMIVKFSASEFIANNVEEANGMVQAKILQTPPGTVLTFERNTWEALSPYALTESTKAMLKKAYLMGTVGGCLPFNRETINDLILNRKAGRTK